MSIEIETLEKVVLVRVAGSFSGSETEQFSDTLKGIVAQGKGRFVVDLSAANLITSNGLRVLIELRQHVRNQHGDDGFVRLVVYDATGRYVRELVNRSVAVGFHMVVWDGRDNTGREMGSGVYLYRLQWQAASSQDGDSTPDRVRETTVRRMVLVR